MPLVKTLEINQHLLNAYLEGVVTKHLEVTRPIICLAHHPLIFILLFHFQAYQEVAKELEKFNNDRNSMLAALSSAIKSNNQMVQSVLIADNI